MSDTKPIVTLPKRWHDASLSWAERSVAGYDAHEKEASRIYARPGIDKSVDAQFMGKAGECAYAIYLGKSPSEAIDWSPRLGPPHDLIHRGLLIDVKASRSAYLIWPVTKKPFLGQTNVDLFAHVLRIDSMHFELSGWTSVRHFALHHRTAPPPDHFDDGTPHLHPDELWPVSDLIAPNLIAQIAIRIQAQSILVTASSDDDFIRALRSDYWKDRKIDHPPLDDDRFLKKKVA